MKANTKFGENNFAIIDGIVSNSIPEEARNAPTLTLVKERMKYIAGIYIIALMTLLVKCKIL